MIFFVVDPDRYVSVAGGSARASSSSGRRLPLILSFYSDAIAAPRMGSRDSAPEGIDAINATPGGSRTARTRRLSKDPHAGKCVNTKRTRIDAPGTDGTVHA